jgi:uncharacterized membrane protein YraQ (UPF0718 family)
MIYGFCLAAVFDSRQLYLLSVAGALVTGLLIALINSVYFLQSCSLETRYVLPGISSWRWRHTRLMVFDGDGYATIQCAAGSWYKSNA